MLAGWTAQWQCSSSQVLQVVTRLDSQATFVKPPILVDQRSTPTSASQQPMPSHILLGRLDWVATTLLGPWPPSNGSDDDQQQSRCLDHPNHWHRLFCALLTNWQRQTGGTP